MNNRYSQIVPYCIYHYIDNNTNTFYGYIGNPTKIKKLSGNIEFSCPLDTIQNSKWTLYNSFYAFSPMIRPIPKGLKLINALKLGQYPFQTKTIEYQYDPFSIKENSVSFLAWTKPVMTSVPLYIHITSDGNYFPSFEKEPVIKQKGWTQSKLSPIFVLVDPEITGITTDIIGNQINPILKDLKGDPIFKFTRTDTGCTPSYNGMSLEKCFLLTDEDLLNNKKYDTHTLLEEIQKINKQNQNNNFSLNYSSIIYIIIIIFLITSIIILLRHQFK
jgi:hypothetical protein